MGKIIGKNTWIGLGIAVCALLLGLALGAVFLCRDVLHAQSQQTYLTVICGISALLGCLITANGKGQHLLRALVMAGLFYLLLWILTLLTEGTAAFDAYALRTMVAVLLGGVLASLLVPRKERKHTTQKRRNKTAKARKHAVT